MAAENNQTHEKITYEQVAQRFDALAAEYSSSLSYTSMYNALYRAGLGFANQPQIQNQRVKGISSLPVDYTKEDIGEFLRQPYGNEKALRQTSEVLRWTAYPYFKITKTYQDIPTYRYYVKPEYLADSDAENKEYLREATLIDKLNKELRPDVWGHKITGQAVTQGKVFYITRTSVDKVHNKVNYAFMQQLPQDWCQIIGFNNISGYTVSFDLMYFLQPGTDYTQFGDLFEPYMDDFNGLFSQDNGRAGQKYVYASCPTVNCGDRKLNFYPDNLNIEGEGNPRVFKQNGRWFYYVSLPVDRVWTFEIDDTTPVVASPLSGLDLTYSQQADYEAAQLSLLLNPLIKILTGEIPYNDSQTQKQDDYKLSLGGRMLFQAYFDDLMRSHNTGGISFFAAPVDNIKSHDFAESANANEISESFLRYGTEKAGLSALLPTTDDVKAGQVAYSALLESRYSAVPIYNQMMRMMDYLYRSLNLKYTFRFYMFGSVYTEKDIRAAAEKSLATGDLTQMYILAALDDMSLLEKLSMSRAVKGMGILDYLIPPQTSYTQSASSKNGNSEGGRPSKSVGDVMSGDGTEATEDHIDTYGASNS